MRLPIFKNNAEPVITPVKPDTAKAAPPAAPAATLPAPVDTVQLRRQLDNTPFVLEINGEIKDVSIQQVFRQLEQFERWYRKPNGDFDPKRIKVKPIQLNIDSIGGTVSSSLGLLDKLDALKKAGIIVETIVQGMGASMGAVFSNAGSKGHRYASPESTLMIHQVVSFYGAGQQYVSEVGKNYLHGDRLNRLIYERFKANLNGKLSPEALKDAMRENYFMDPQQAKDIGLIDHVGFPPVKGFDEASDTKAAK